MTERGGDGMGLNCKCSFYEDEVRLKWEYGCEMEMCLQF